ncbi:acyl-CoA dehydrogenase family protein [Pseudonocardia ailaonensis]|uniref:acyl-CoA dehydrogenase family protein n=1 Tax=Pseudonocardia ailaonensis TaxID=367279 RepID=UPI0031CE49C1
MRTEEQRSLAEIVRSFVAKRSPLSAIRVMITEGRAYDQDVWRTLSGELGLSGLIVPEHHGGTGGSWADLAVALAELGAGLVPSPLLASGVLVSGALMASDDEDVKAELLPRLADGSLLGALAVSEAESPRWIPDRPRTVARNDGDGVRLSGRKNAVLNGCEADVLLVQAVREGRSELHLVDRGTSGLSVTRTPAIDPTRSVASVELEDCLARPLAGDATAALSQLADLADFALAAEQVGALRACLEMTVQYAGSRFAFGQPIGAYQGVKHKLADMYTQWSLCDAALRVAAEAEGSAEQPTTAAAVRALTSSTYADAAQTAMLLHGGLGFTWEHDAHLYLKNAIAGNVLLGEPAERLERVALGLGLA